MAEKYYVVLNQGAFPSDFKEKSVPKTSCEIEEGLKSAKFIKVLSNAGTVAEAIELAKLAYPGEVTGPPIVVTAAAWKES